jgi:hypothetical protein
MKLLNSFLQWFDETAFWHFLSKNVIAHLTFRIDGYPGFDFDKWPELQEVLEKSVFDPFHVYAFVLADRKSLSSILVRWISKSDWSHAGIIAYPFAYHMKGKGLIKQGILNLVHECDDFAVIKIPVTEANAAHERIEWYKKRVGQIHYDFEQELEEQASINEKKDIYCSELVYVIVKGISAVKPSLVAGRLVFSPDDVYKSGEVIFVHRIPRKGKTK